MKIKLFPIVILDMMMQAMLMANAHPALNCRITIVGNQTLNNAGEMV